MIKKNMYKEIKRLKLKGNSKSFVSQKLRITRNSVIKYWDMSEDEYQQYLIRQMFRNKEFDKFKDEILEVYAANEYKKLQGSSIFDYLEEKYNEYKNSESKNEN